MKTIKDLQIGDVCYGLYRDGYLVLFSVVAIQTTVAESFYRIILNQFNNGKTISTVESVNETILEIDDIDIYLSKNDIKEKLLEMKENINESLEIIGE